MLQAVQQIPFILYRILRVIIRKDVENLLDDETFVIQLVSPFENRFNKTETKIKHVTSQASLKMLIASLSELNKYRQVTGCWTLVRVVFTNTSISAPFE
jgi:hypothetical protein